MSNPFKLPSYRGVIGDLQAGAIAAVALGGAFYASRMIGNLASRYVPGAHAGIPRFLVKLGVATATVWAAKQVTRDPGLRKVVLAGAYFPLVVETVAMVAPGVAMQMAVVPALPAPAAASGVSAYLGMPPGDRLSDYTLNAELEAELETDSEFGIY